MEAYFIFSYIMYEIAQKAYIMITHILLFSLNLYYNKMV